MGHIIAVPHLIAAYDTDVATITATLAVNNTSADALEGRLSGDVLDDVSGLSVLSAPLAASVTLPPGEGAAIQLSTTIARPQLWHFDHPSLYRWSAALQTGCGHALHTAEVTFGIRTVEFKDARLYPNGESVRLVGLTRHADPPTTRHAPSVLPPTCSTNLPGMMPRLWRILCS